MAASLECSEFISSVPQRYVLCSFFICAVDYAFNMNHMIVHGGKAVAITYLSSLFFPTTMILIEPEATATSLTAFSLYGAAHDSNNVYSKESNHVTLALKRDPVTAVLTMATNATVACTAGFYSMTVQFSTDVSGLTESAFRCDECHIGNITRTDRQQWAYLICVRRSFLVEVVVGEKGTATVQLRAGTVVDGFLNANDASNVVVLEYGGSL